MKKQTIIALLLVVLVALAGCTSAGGSDGGEGDRYTNSSYTFTKDAAGVDGYWSCIVQDDMQTGNQMECELITEDT